MNIRNILKGCKVGNMQHVGIFTMIELLMDSNLQDEEFVAPNDVQVTNSGYGNLTFINVSDKTVIVPSHASYITRESAQDHAMMKMGYVPKKSTKVYNDCACIQQTQGGYLSKSSKQLSILPWSLRAEATSLKGKNDFRKLWPAIVKFNKEAGINRSEGHLVYFYEKFEKELEEFVVQFEPVPMQVGAIILINGVVFGIERAPNEAFFRNIFDALIRTCYGTAAIRIANGMDPKKTSDYKTYVHISSKVKSTEDIAKNYKEAVDKEMELSRQIVNELIDEPLKVDVDETLSSIQTVTISNEQMIGQTMLKAGDPVYSSIVIQKEWLLKNKKWAKAETFQI